MKSMRYSDWKPMSSGQMLEGPSFVVTADGAPVAWVLVGVAGAMRNRVEAIASQIDAMRGMNNANSGRQPDPEQHPGADSTGDIQLHSNGDGERTETRSGSGDVLLDGPTEDRPKPQRKRRTYVRRRKSPGRPAKE